MLVSPLQLSPDIKKFVEGMIAAEREESVEEVSPGED